MNRTLLIAGIVTLLAIGTAQAAGDAQAGKVKAAMCAACHGVNGEGIAANPALAGKKEDQLIQAMKEYKSGQRDNAVMKGILSSLSDQDLANLAAYYASLKGK